MSKHETEANSGLDSGGSAGVIRSSDNTRNGLVEPSICDRSEGTSPKKFEIDSVKSDGRVQEKEAETPFGIPLAARNEAVAEGREKAIMESHGVLSVIGRRRDMEDAVTAVEMGGEIGRYCFFGVYDGHNGAEVANACKKRMHRLVAEEVAVGKRGSDEGVVVDWEKVMAASFSRMDEEVSCRGGGDAEGVKVMAASFSRMVVVVTEEEVVVANCGDCRAVLCRDDVPLPLSRDHKEISSYTAGDFYLNPYVISEPEITVTNRTEHDEFLVMASDGLWDVVSNEDACEVVRRWHCGQTRRLSNKLGGSNNTCEAAAVLLAELALARGSDDNISAMVLELKEANKTSI